MRVSGESLRIFGPTALIVLAVVTTGLAGARGLAGEPAKYSRAVLIRLEGMIGPRLEHYLDGKLKDAEATKADLVIVEIESPGGYLVSSENIAARLRDLRWARTVAFVPAEALSGAALIALGCDDIVMASQARIGDAGPIYQAEDFMFKHAPEKIRADLIEFARGLAEAKHRPPALAEAMIDMNVVVYEVRNTRTGRVTYMNDREWESLPDKEQWQKGLPVLESNRGVFLEVLGTKALELGLARAAASTRDELRQVYHLSGNQLMIVEPTAVDTAVYILNWPLVTGLLFVIGLVGLYFEFSAPGTCIGGLVAALCFGVFFWSHFLGGTAGWLEVILFLAGAAFLAMEVFVIPGTTVAGLTGVLLILASLIMASQSFLVPRTVWQWQMFGTTLAVVGGSLTAFLAAGIFMTWYFGTIPVLGRLVLAPPSPHEAPPGPAVATSVAVAGGRRIVAVGQIGEAVSPLRPAGKARFADDLVDVLTEGDFVDQGSRVRVVRVQGTSIVVRQVSEA